MVAADLDDLRAARPGWGFALYAFEPGAGVTLEAHAPSGDIFTFVGASAGETIRNAMPEGWNAAKEKPHASVFD